MFGEDTHQFSIVEAAIASLTNKAATQLRAEQLLARTATLYLSTNRHKPGYQRLSRNIRLEVPTADGGQITAQIIGALKAGFNPRSQYHRVNILLYDLLSEDALQANLFDNTGLEAARSAMARLQAVDAINTRWGHQTLHYAAEDLSNAWQPKRALRSPRYTTNWEELPSVRTP